MEFKQITRGIDLDVAMIYTGIYQRKENYFPILETLNSELPKKRESKVEEKGSRWKVQSD